ncbi:hypothetical protein [Sediminibacterium soli]|uniref:hypothetical protein n=1 Tax=Sediminibacterium soli TaxID=2698829 RepID=UPI00137ABDA0|nr:hypothetical protein [Sediminibacterium soli]NCI46406.1 hypothetical protein [Sediminibacterium soli]
MLITLGVCLLSFASCDNTHSYTGYSVQQDGCFHLIDRPGDTGQPELTKTDPDQEGHSRVFIRTRGTLKSFIRNQPVFAEAYAAFPPVLSDNNKPSYGTPLIRPAYYRFLFRYQLF